MSVAPPGTCFGFEIHSTLSFEFLREGSGEALEVEPGRMEGPGGGNLIFDWPAAGDQPHTRLFQDDGTLGDDALRREERLWSLPLLLCFAARGDVPLHAAAVDVGGSAVLIAAPRTFGKTTLAAGFLAAGHRVLSEDIACIRLDPEPHVVPGPAMLRVRPDVADDLELRDTLLVGRDETRVHLALAPHGRGTCDPVPLRAIIFLRESDQSPTLVRVSAAEALPDLWELNFRLLGAPAFASSFEALADLVRSISIWNLFRQLGLDRLDETVEAVLACV